MDAVFTFILFCVRTEGLLEFGVINNCDGCTLVFDWYEVVSDVDGLMVDGDGMVVIEIL